jgi:hypothetical protein
MIGPITVSTRFTTTSPIALWPKPDVPTSPISHIGVRNIPMRFPNVALKRAAGSLPPADFTSTLK